jgi:hypothetical protein
MKKEKSEKRKQLEKDAKLMSFYEAKTKKAIKKKK